MKTILTSLTAVLITISVYSQAPQGVNYQAIVRNNAGEEITDQSIGVQVSVLHLSPTGSPVYVERFTTMSNGYGLINLVIGTGAVQDGVFADILWNEGPYYIKLDIDENGGTNYTSMDASKIISVPYALHAETAGMSLEEPIWQKNSTDAYYSEGNVGIGTTNPGSILEVVSSPGWADEEPLFEVNNEDGIPVFAVYNNGVRILVEDDPLAKGRIRGGFSVGGFDRSKKGFVETYDFMRISPDSIRFNINNTAVKGSRGGFAVGGFDRSKKEAINEDFMYLVPGPSEIGSYNSFFGYGSGRNLRNGAYNLCLGYNAGSELFNGASNVIIGANAGDKVVEGSKNVVIGADAGIKMLPDATGNIIIGNGAGSGEDVGNNKLIIGSGDPATPLISGDFLTTDILFNGNIIYTGDLSQTSDQILKTNLTNISNANTLLEDLNGYYFDWNDIARESMAVNEKRQIGLLAQEVERVFPELVGENSDGYKTVNYIQLTPVLLEAIKEQQSEIQDLKNELSDQKLLIEELRALVLDMARDVNQSNK